jgi:hypothetical protein
MCLVFSLYLAQKFLFNEGDVIENGSISQVRPDDKMATDIQNGGIIVLSEFSLGFP